MRKAIFPGSFDPFTLGHLDILKRNFELMDLKEIVISGSAKQKVLDFVDRKPNSLNSFKFRQMYLEDGF